MYARSLAIFRQCKAIGSINCHIYPINKYLILLTLVMDCEVGIPICVMYCTGFHSHSASHTGSRPRCGGACLVGRPPILCRPLYATVLCQGTNFVISFAHSVTMQTRSFSVVSNNLEWTSTRSKAPPKCYLFSIPPPSQDCSFPLGLGLECL